jgi:hypothetical protein
MAHRSKKKHLKHMHQHEPATPKAKSPVAKAEAAASGVAKNGGNVRRSPELQNAGKKKKGLVRRVASKVTKKITAKPRGVIARAKNRVKSALGAD